MTAATITVTCPTCHVNTTVPGTDVVWHRGGTADPAGLGFYTFTCPGCGPMRQPVHPLIERVLQRGGVRTTTWPAGVTTRPAGPPLTLDDLIDLHAAIARTNGAAA